MSRILPLPQEAISQIHSSKHIVSLQGVALSLLENSLDAGSSRVEIAVDFTRGGCTVEDNGTGIPTDDFHDQGGLCRMYHTSKSDQSSAHELHGSTGTYLASLAALSLLNVSSHRHDHREHATLTMHCSRVVSRQISAPSTQEDSAFAQYGTRIVVRDLFGNMPVRVKERALRAEASDSRDRAWRELKHGVVALLLAWPKPCSVRIRDANNEHKHLRLSGQHLSHSALLTEKSLKALAGKSTQYELQDALPILFQAGLAPTESRLSWVPVSASTLKVSVKGAICLDPVPSKQCQFISIGIHPCSISFGHSELYDAVNRVFTNSSFGSVDEDSEIEESEKDRRKSDRRYKSNGYTQKQLQGQKGTDRWPMLVLRVRLLEHRIKHASAENISSIALKSVIDILEATLTQWLVANHFRPRTRRKRKKREHYPLTAISSSPKSSSVYPLPNSKPSPCDPATPTLRNPLIVENATTSKKRKLVYMDGRTDSLSGVRSGHVQALSADFSSWSRIKSGRQSFYDEMWQGRKPATAPARQSGSIASPVESRQKHKFSLPPLDVGELSSTVGKKHGRRTPGMPDAPVCAAGPDGRLSSEDFGSVDESAMLAAVEVADCAHQGPRSSNGLVDEDGDVLEQVPNDSVIDWMDPVSKQVFRVNARTGVVLPAKSTPIVVDPDCLATAPARHTAAIDTSMSSTGKPLSLARRTKHPSRSGSDWLPGFIKEWNNPVFNCQDEEQIQVASLDGPGADATDAAARVCKDPTKPAVFAQVRAGETNKISKAALKEARVIRQVDRKFILCKTNMMKGKWHKTKLILVDQHAASERVILEGLLSEPCTPLGSPATRRRSRFNVVSLDKPIRFVISTTDFQLFQSHKQHFADWGMVYHLLEKEEPMTALSVKAPKRELMIVVDMLPTCIAERCTLNPKLLIELLRSEVWQVAGSTKHSVSRSDEVIRDPPPTDDGTHAWLRRVGACPKGILDMINSRACRSAIMFNDELSTAQCEDLLHDLGSCAFPFMCAHGRASMVPIIDLNGENSDEEGLGGTASGLFGTDQSAERFTDAFKRWACGKAVDRLQSKSC